MEKGAEQILLTSKGADVLHSYCSVEPRCGRNAF